jgi:hypothetical protein
VDSTCLILIESLAWFGPGGQAGAISWDSCNLGIGQVAFDAEQFANDRVLFEADKEENMAIRASPAPGVLTGKPLIESDRVEGTTVYDPSGNNIGSVRRLMIDKMSGRVAYAVIVFDTFLGLGGEEYTLPWSKLDYDTSLEGFRTDITEAQLRGAPTFYRDRDYAWNDRERERELHEYWRSPFYWGP